MSEFVMCEKSTLISLNFSRGVSGSTSLRQQAGRGSVSVAAKQYGVWGVCYGQRSVMV